MSTKSEKKEKQNKERKNIEIGIGSPTASAKRPLSPGAATLLATTIDAPEEPPVLEFRPPMPPTRPPPRNIVEAFKERDRLDEYHWSRRRRPKVNLRAFEKREPMETVFAPAFDMPERTSTPRRYPQEEIDDFEASFEDFQSVPAPDVPLKKGGGYMYPSLKNYMKRSNRKSKKKSKRKSKRKSKKNSKKKSKKARRRH